MRVHLLGLGQLATLALFVHQPSLAQTPSVEGVSNLVWFGGAFSPGVLAEIYGYGFSKDATVEVQGRRATVTAFSPTAWAEEYQYLFIQVPFEVQPGPATVVVTTGAGSSRPFPVKLETHAPGLYSHFIGADGRKYPSCSPGGTPSRGELLIAQAVGLGANQTGRVDGDQAQLTVGGQASEVLAVASAAVGVYDVSFHAP
jgi:uncharacterized protein (TIGR03437 family)